MHGFPLLTRCGPKEATNGRDLESRGVLLDAGRLGPRVPLERGARVGHVRVPEEELVDAVAAGGGDLSTHLRRAVRDSEREILQPRYEAGGRPRHVVLEVEE